MYECKFHRQLFNLSNESLVTDEENRPDPPNVDFYRRKVCVFLVKLRYLHTLFLAKMQAKTISIEIGDLLSTLVNSDHPLSTSQVARR